MAGVVGCAAMAPRPAGYPTGPAPSSSRIAEALAAKSGALQTLRAEARLDYRGPSGRLRSKQIVAVAAPDRIRVDVLHAFGVSYSVAIDGSVLTVFDRREDVFYQGRATAGALGRFLGVALAPTDLAAILRGLPPLPQDPSSQVRHGEGGWRWLLGEPGARQLDVLVDAETLDPIRLELGGDPGLVAVFDDYREVEGVTVAHRLDVRLGDGSTLEIRYDAVRRSVAFPATAFRIDKPAGVRGVDLDREGARGA